MKIKDKLLTKIKRKLGICTHIKCFNKAIYDIEIPTVKHKGCLCEKHFKEVKDMQVFNFKETECNNVKKSDMKSQIHEMYEHGYTIENIVENLSEFDCVQSFRDCPFWCHENADCNDCWTKCLEKELEG